MRGISLTLVDLLFMSFSQYQVKADITSTSWVTVFNNSSQADA